jgi:GTPase SAR1 family protein
VQGIVLVFDITDRISFENAIPRLAFVHKHAKATCKRVLVGNWSQGIAIGRVKKRAVSHEEALKFAHDNDMEYFETSAVDNIGIRESLFVLTRQVLAGAGVLQAPSASSALQFAPRMSSSSADFRAECANWLYSKLHNFVED